MSPKASLAQCARNIILAREPSEKISLAIDAAARWRAGELALPAMGEDIDMPERPGRPEKPELLEPRQMPRRGMGSPQKRIALVHSLAHIELNAIDMTWDSVGRFCNAPLPRTFVDEAVQVGLDEAYHFRIINEQLEHMGASYGDLPAHAGLWDAAVETAGDLLARLAIVPMVLEARGLDVSPPMMRQAEKAGQISLLAVMKTIYHPCRLWRPLVHPFMPKAQYRPGSEIS
jgi:uncharacterized ferritin-like protein (DUF455 family)